VGSGCGFASIDPFSLNAMTVVAAAEGQVLLAGLRVARDQIAVSID